jgi:hypothetical protein
MKKKKKIMDNKCEVPPSLCVCVCVSLSLSTRSSTIDACERAFEKIIIDSKCERTFEKKIIDNAFFLFFLHKSTV